MIAQLKSLKKEVEETKNYKEWKEKNPNSYFVSAFFLGDKFYSKSKEWQFDFYEADKDKVVSFIYGKDEPVKEEEIFKKTKDKLGELVLEDIKFDLDKAIFTFEKIKSAKHPSETATKKLFILQVLEGKPVWNITYISSSFNILNIKIDAISGEVVSESFSSVLSFKDKELSKG